MEKILSRDEVKAMDEDYREILDTENHHGHEIIEGIGGVIRWRENPVVREIIDKINLNFLIILLEQLGFGRNSEVYRKLYRDMGYSLSGYYDIFYWEVNNDKADQYQPLKGKEYTEGRLSVINEMIDFLKKELSASQRPKHTPVSLGFCNGIKKALNNVSQKKKNLLKKAAELGIEIQDTEK